MIGFIQQTGVAQALTGTLQRVQGWLAPALLRRRSFRASLVASVVSVVYWGAIASDRYVSEAHIVIQRTDLAGGQTMDFGGLLPGVGNVGHSDQLLLRDHLLSVDMLGKLDAKLELRKHFSDTARDPLSRMWHRHTPLERFHRHYLSRVGIEFDEYAGVLVIKAQAYDPETAHAIAALLVEEGERYMNGLAHRLAEEQVAFLEKQVAEMSERAIEARREVIVFQNEQASFRPRMQPKAAAPLSAGSKPSWRSCRPGAQPCSAISRHTPLRSLKSICKSPPWKSKSPRSRRARRRPLVKPSIPPLRNSNGCRWRRIFPKKSTRQRWWRWKKAGWKRLAH